MIPDPPAVPARPFSPAIPSGLASNPSNEGGGCLTHLRRPGVRLRGGLAVRWGQGGAIVLFLCTYCLSTCCHICLNPPLHIVHLNKQLSLNKSCLQRPLHRSHKAVSPCDVMLRHVLLNEQLNTILLCPHLHVTHVQLCFPLQSAVDDPQCPLLLPVSL
jgi:hypothetical protein